MSTGARERLRPAGVAKSCDRWMSAVTTQIEDPTQVEGMTIGQLSALVGVPVPTLRSWERRYHMQPTSRPVGTTRHYSLHDAQMLTLMRDDVAGVFAQRRPRSPSGRSSTSTASARRSLPACWMPVTALTPSASG
jgi:MerR HTH family regulatory protein